MTISPTIGKFEANTEEWCLIFNNKVCVLRQPVPVSCLPGEINPSVEKFDNNVSTFNVHTIHLFWNDKAQVFAVNHNAVFLFSL